MGLIHIDTKTARKEAKNLELQSEELRAESKLLAQQAEELMSVWRGASAKRVEAAMMSRSKDAGKLATSLGVISTCLRETANWYELKDAHVPHVSINVRFG